MIELDVTKPVPQASVEPVLRGAALADLAQLYDPGVMLVSAPTFASPGAVLHAQALAEAGPRRSTVEVSTPNGVPVAGVLDRLSLGAEEHARAWVSYLEEVTETFADLLGAQAVGVRQIVSDGPHCPRFHVDQVPARGILNVQGAVTEWMNEADIDRSRIGHAGGPDDETSGLIRQWNGVNRVEVGSLAVFKGTAWPGAAERAVVHRSPPADGIRRVVLTFDWLE